MNQNNARTRTARVDVGGEEGWIYDCRLHKKPFVQKFVPLLKRGCLRTSVLGCAQGTRPKRKTR
ncbi:hypothetical protein Rmet_6740 (plasmid) [Cupriavidus metallidurans CH34]|uniref:Uncharacterized protein n=1 Tax=Cupriavidus metallidurans (strain ATCC 43123 / DSM 2839 / NBRC 102507 / CH34) TaxID=266264 RepID=D3DYE9_CUPMC|nr:hypothetical protein Rmet_6740 [Cupriavidus metallidurans CH34]